MAQDEGTTSASGISKHWLAAIMFIQICFIGALMYAGTRARENRKADYLELTHRATAGEATLVDFEKLAAFLPEKADKVEVRALFGLPLVRASKVEITGDKPETISGEIWLYYAPFRNNSERGVESLDSVDAAKLSGPVECFLVTFDERGRAKARRATVVHPVKKE